MSHDAKVLLGREVWLKYRMSDRSKHTLRVVATSSDSSGTVHLHLMKKDGTTHSTQIEHVQFCKVWDYETQELVDVE